MAAITCSMIAATAVVARTVIVLATVFGITAGCTAICGALTIWLRSCESSWTSAFDT